jgi:hypothetical protein
MTRIKPITSDGKKARSLSSHAKADGSEMTDLDSRQASPSPRKLTASILKDVPIEERTNRWLTNMGLEQNAFQHLEASADWNIPYYLIDHQQFDHLISDQPAFVFAPPGGGKTAFRMRLARDCRSSTIKPLIFPIIYLALPPNKYTIEEKDKEFHLERIARSAAQELLLQLAYHFVQFKDFPENIWSSIREILDWNLARPLRHYLAMLKREGSVRPLIAAFDRSYAALPNPPRRQELDELCDRLNAIPPSHSERPGASQRAGIIFNLLKDGLHFRSVYLLIDGVDGYFETANNPQRAIAVIKWLLDQTAFLADNNIYCKYFLPSDLLPLLTEDYPQLLTSYKNIANIKWDAETLIAVVQQRLREASGNRFDSLRAISNRELRGADESPEATIVRNVLARDRLRPREVIQLVQRLFLIHIESDPQADKKLSPRDLHAALNWYNQRA